MEATSNEAIVGDDNDDENNGGEVTDSAEQVESTVPPFNNETSHTRNKTYFYPKFVSFEKL
jgi:hypothetical protein